MDSPNSALSITTTSPALPTQTVNSVMEPHSAPVQETDAKEQLSTDTEVKQSELEAVVTQLNAQAQNISRSISFTIDQDSGKTIVRVFNSATDELIRQMPGDEILKLAAAMQEGQANSLLFNTEA